MNKTLKQYLEEICSSDFSGVDAPINKLQERKIPGLNDEKIKKRVNKRKSRKRKSEN